MLASSSLRFGTQTRPSLRSDSDISVSVDWKSPLTGMQVGWICVKHGFAKLAPRLYARYVAVTLYSFGVRRQEVDVAIAAGRQHHGVRGVRGDRAGDEIAHGDAGGAAVVVDHDVEHLGAREHRRPCRPPICRDSAAYTPSSSCWPVWPRA